jgi:quercetin dioxygenase-like cupin family protein
MNVLPMPPGAVAKAHYHDGIETISYLLEGECAVYYGDNLQKRVLVPGRPVFRRRRHAARSTEREREAVHMDRRPFVRQ